MPDAVAMPATLRCPKCRMFMAADSIHSFTPVRCNCGLEMTVIGFPALYAAAPVSVVGDRAGEGEAVCFFHADRKASIACDKCGRYLCALCDLPVGASHLCPSCLESGLNKRESMQQLVTSRILWSQLSFFLGAVLFLVFAFVFPVYIATGTAAIVCAILAFNKPGSLVRGRRPLVAVLGFLFGLAQLLCVFAIFSQILKNISRGL